MAFHFIGIKGTGMAALACILHDEHFDVTGSDIEKYIFTQDGLEERGIPFTTFDPANIKDGDTVIIGLSFDETHPEVKAALDNPSVRTIYYNDYLGELLTRYQSICVAGTHGKSTTTGLLASCLQEEYPTGYLIGDGHGHMPEDAKYFILESCEFQRHFLAYHPDYAIITNIELDHVDYYHDMEDYISAFQSFADQVQKGLVYCGDDPWLPGLDYKVPAYSYGLSDACDYQARDVEQDENGTRYSVYFKGEKLADVAISEAGKPFLWNSLGTFALCHMLGEDTAKIVEGLQAFKGIARRFNEETAGKSVLVDDYAHHPTAIEYMIEAVRQKYPHLPVVALYKPDRYSRLQYFLDRFASSLAAADHVFLLDFPKNAVREDETITVTIDDLKERIPGAELIEIDQAGADRLKALGPAAYLFMSSKDIYLLRDLLRADIDGQPED